MMSHGGSWRVMLSDDVSWNLSRLMSHAVL